MNVVFYIHTRAETHSPVYLLPQLVQRGGKVTKYILYENALIYDQTMRVKIYRREQKWITELDQELYPRVKHAL